MDDLECCGNGVAGKNSFWERQPIPHRIRSEQPHGQELDIAELIPGYFISSRYAAIYKLRLYKSTNNGLCSPSSIS
jgi:hypothetical protein